MKARRFSIVLEPTGIDTGDVHELRGLLKVLLRRHQLRCITCSEVTTDDEQHAAVTITTANNRSGS